MTIIAYRDGVLAADRLVSFGDGRCGETRKIVRGIGGHIAGGSGSLESVERFLQWVETGAEGDPPPGKDSDGLVIYSNGRVLTWTGTNVLAEVRGPFHATGSGWRFALGAMEAGVSARRAVEIAIKRDTQCGGGIDVLRLRKARK